MKRAGLSAFKHFFELLADAKVVVEYGHSTPVEFFVANVLAAVMRFP